MLINERKPLGTDAYLESDLLERELENGVIVEYSGFVDEESRQTILGGLISAQEHVYTREANLTPPRRRAK